MIVWTCYEKKKKRDLQAPNLISCNVLCDLRVLAFLRVLVVASQKPNVGVHSNPLLALTSLTIVDKKYTLGTGRRSHYERGLFTGEISRVSSKLSKFSRISRKWSASSLFSTVSGISNSSRISKFFEIYSRKWTFLKRPLFQKTPFSEPDALHPAPKSLHKYFAEGLCNPEAAKYTKFNEVWGLKVCFPWRFPAHPENHLNGAIRGTKGPVSGTRPHETPFNCTHSTYSFNCRGCADL